MSADKDKPDSPAGGGGKPATKTVVGVPALPGAPPAEVPPDPPSDAALTRQMPAMKADDTAPREGPTAIDVKAMGRAEAERVLAWTGFSQEEIPTVQGGVAQNAQKGAGQQDTAGAAKTTAGTAGALPKPITQSVRVKTPSPSAGEMFPGLGRPATSRGLEPEKGTRSGVAPQAPVAPHGRSTLLLDNSAPPGTAAATENDVERPPIVVPGPGQTPPKAVTQPPPWGEGAARVSPAIPHGPPPVREPEPSVEELSGSLLLPADVTGEAQGQGGVEELSGSVLIEDAPDGTPVVKAVIPGAAGGTQVTRTPSVKPPVPKSSTRPSGAHPHRTMLGGVMPDLPKATPAPKLDYVPNASGEPMAIPVPEPVPDPFADVQWMPPSAQGAPQEGQPGAPPAASPLTGDIEVNRLPRGGIQPLLDASKRAWKRFLEQAGPVSRRLLEQTKALAKRAQAALPEHTALRSDSRPKWFLPAVAAAGLVVGIGLVGLIVSAARGGSRASERPSASASASAALGTGASASPATAPAPAAAPEQLPACTVVGPPHVIGPNATVAAGVEVVRAADDLAIGFAPGEHQAMAVRVDPTSVSAINTTRANSHDAVKRVTPTVSTKGALSLVVDADRSNDRLGGRRTVLASPAVQLGVADGHVAWSKLGGPPVGQLWPLDGGDSIDAVRGATENAGPAQTIAVAFRKGASVWFGTLDDSGSSLAVRGDLSHVDGLGSAVGSPAIAISDGVVLAAWSDRPSSDAPWKLRWVRFQAGQPAGAANAFEPPAGGKGEQSMSPGLAALPGGRFLLVWTEGPQSGHDVRALTLGPDGAPIGGPLTISTPGVNAGQGQAAVTESGSGVVGFLQTGGSGFEVVATPVSCGKP